MLISWMLSVTSSSALSSFPVCCQILHKLVWVRLAVDFETGHVVIKRVNRTRFDILLSSPLT